MKRILFILFSLIMVSSCLDDGSGTTQKYQGRADFEYGAGAQFLPDSTFFNTKQAEGFGFDILNFYHQLDASKSGVDGGFILSQQKMPVSGKTEGLNNRYRCHIGQLKDQFENTYAVFRSHPEPSFMPKHAISFSLPAHGTCEIVGAFFTNTVEVVEAVKANFKDGDKLVATFTGYLGGEKKAVVEVKLAEYTEKKDSLMTTWVPVDLKLGKIEHVDIEVTSTNPAVPTYFCMDHLVYNAELIY
mgnify:CR=1 FL=1